MEFEYQGRTDNFFLIKRGYRGIFYPFLPIQFGAYEKILRCAFDRRFKRAAVGEHKVDRLAQYIWDIIKEMAHRHIGSQAHFDVSMFELYMIAAPVFFKILLSVVILWRACDPNTGMSADGLYLSDEHEGLEITFVLFEAGGKVRDPIAAFLAFDDSA